MKNIYKFKEKERPKIYEVGGKAYSLINMSHADFPVPDGFVCSPEFFKPWSNIIEQTDEWKKLQQAITKDEEIGTFTESIQNKIKTLKFSEGQKEALAEAIKTFDLQASYAVRSSSPEEDLSGSSFAGMYETVLGIKKEGLEKAIISVFSSAFDERVLVYKKQKGFSLKEAKIAVIIMTQINAERSGVGFSVNPINNDYDEAFINANFGLGESIVGGMVTPDDFVIQKIDKKIIKKQLGNKEKSVYLSDKNSGGTVTQTNKDAAEYSISDEQALEITEMIIQVEKLYDVPVDIEWAYTGNKLYMLQARPITTYIPLPPEMISSANNKKRTLYYDTSVVEGITTNDPITPMTLDWTLQGLGEMMMEPYMGKHTFSANGDVKTDLMFGKGVRMYINFSQVFFVLSPKTMAEEFKDIDKSLADALINIDLDTYLPEKKFPIVRWRSIIPFGIKIFFHALHLIPMWIKDLMNPLKFYRKIYKPAADKILSYLSEPIDERMALHSYMKESAEKMKAYFTVAMPVIAAYMSNLRKLNALFENETSEIKMLGDQLTMGVEGDEVVDLGISLYNLSQLLLPDDFLDLDKLVERLEDKQLPEKFQKEWVIFLAKYGCRGPNEMEVANSRYGDDPRLAFEQMSYMQHAQQNPAELLKKHVQEKKEAYKALLEKLDDKKVKQLKKYYEVTNNLSAARDTLKYVMILNLGTVRKLALRDAKLFMDAGRLKSTTDIFYLEFDDIQKAHRDSDFNLQTIVDKRMPFYKLAEGNVRAFPAFIDSRGRIPNLDQQAQNQHDDDPNVLRGNGISRGVAKGRIKVLKNPREKKIEKGDILVAYTTDPGWTPLFIGAEAIILEVGGMLQHGGVVAREYAKPCVAGIYAITEKLKDGQMVEVDGNNGIIKILE